MRHDLWILLRWPLRAWLHRRCLRRIAALEVATGLAPDPYRFAYNMAISDFFPNVSTYAQQGLLNSGAFASDPIIQRIRQLPTERLDTTGR